MTSATRRQSTHVSGVTMSNQDKGIIGVVYIIFRDATGVRIRSGDLRWQHSVGILREM
jgi:hypothetical protein